MSKSEIKKNEKRVLKELPNKYTHTLLVIYIDTYTEVKNKKKRITDLSSSLHGIEKFYPPAVHLPHFPPLYLSSSSNNVGELQQRNKKKKNFIHLAIRVYTAIGFYLFTTTPSVTLRCFFFLFLCSFFYFLSFSSSYFCLMCAATVLHNPY